MYKKKILILGATGMLGHTLMVYLSKNKKIEAFDGLGKVHCFNMNPQVVMMGRIK